MRQTWTFHSAGQIVFGLGAVGQVGRLAARLKISRVFIVTDPKLVAAGLLDAVRGPIVEAGLKFELFEGGEPEPSLKIAQRCVDRARTFHPDGLIGLGGGSNMDLTKIAAVLLAHGGSPRDYLGEDRVPGPVLPLICIPTTAGTGSEVSHCSVLTDQDNQLKVSTLSNYLRPNVAIVDPRMTLSCPRKVTADSGIDALTHAIEAYTAVENSQYALPPGETSMYQGRHPLGDCLAEQAIRLIAANLVTAVEQPDNLVAREAMSLAALLAGLAFSNVGVALVHALEYPVGGATHCSHGEGNGLLLPHVMRFNLPERPKQFARIAQMLGQDIAGLDEPAAAERAIAAVENLSRTIGIRQRLRDLGAAPEQIPTFAEKAFKIKRLLRVNPRAATLEDLVAILTAAY